MKPGDRRGIIGGIAVRGWGIALTDVDLRKTKPREKSFKLYDKNGLFVMVRPTGSKLFRMRYIWEGREKLLSFGPYPEVPLARARERCLAARAVLREGRDPGYVIVLADAPQPDPTRTFEVIAREWHALQAPLWTKVHAKDVLDSLVAGIFPRLGAMQITTITPPTLLEVLRAIEARGAIETAHRVRQRCSAVFQHAMASGRAESDPAAVVARALAPVIKGRQPAIIDLDAARAMLLKAEAEPAHPTTKLGLRLLALTAARSSEIRLMTWDEVEHLEGADPLWRVPAERMKMKREHLIPLSRQAVEVLFTAQRLSGAAGLVFPSARWAKKPLSENAFGYLLNRAGFHHAHVPHGWRATFSSIMNERYRDDRAIIDKMLAHASGDKTEAAYNRAAHLDRRRELAQAWADLILENAPAAATLWTGARRRCSRR